MKKTYMMPEVSEIEVSANQAVAGCRVMMKYWQNSDNRNPTGYPSRQAALDAQPDWASSTAGKVCPVYYYEYAQKQSEYYTAEGSGYWEDWNENGVYDGGDNIQNQVNNVPSDLSVNWGGVLFNS